MSKRNVKTQGAALSRTNRPLGDGLENVVAGLGTERDKRSYTTYAFPRLLTRTELENMYRGSWLAKRIVNAVADDMTREWLHCMFDDGSPKRPDKKTESQFALELAEKKWGIKAKVNEALRWARLYGGCLIIIGTKDSKDLEKPLDISKVQKGQLRYLQVLDRWRIAPTGDIDQNLESRNFGLPLYYMIAESSVRVHNSRVLRFNGEKLPYFAWRQNGMWDDSSLQHVLDSLTNCDTTTQGIASMVFESNVDVVTSEGLSNVLSTKDGEGKLLKRFQLAGMLKSFNRMLLLDGKEKYEKKQNSFANLDKIMQQFQVDVCGAADYPMARLFGQSASGLNANGDNDVRNYYDKLKAGQTTDLMPQLEPLYEVLCRSELGYFPKDFRIEFNPLWQISETERATIENTRATRDKVYIDEGVISPRLVATELKERGTYRNMTDDDIEMAAEMTEPMDEEGNVGAPGTKNKNQEDKPDQDSDD